MRKTHAAPVSRRLCAGWIVVITAGLLAGCHCPCKQAAAPPEHSLVFRGRGDDGASPSRWLPWYAARNDRQPEVVIGYGSPSADIAVSRQWDRQSSHGGNVRNHFDSTTYRYRSDVLVR